MSIKNETNINTFRELPEPMLTTDLLPRFEEAAALPTSTEQEKELKILVEQQLPLCNRILLSWIFLHFDAIIAHEKHNKFNPQNLAVVLSPVLQMSHRLFVTLLCYCTDLFPDVQLTKWVMICLFELFFKIENLWFIYSNTASTNETFCYFFLLK